MARKAKSIGTKGVGLKNLGAGLEVVLVNGEDQVGVRQVQLVITAVDENTARIEDRAHGAISEHGAAGKDIGKLSHSLVMLSHAFRECIRLCGERRRVLARMRGPGIESSERVALLYFESQKLCRTGPG